MMVKKIQEYTLDIPGGTYLDNVTLSIAPAFRPGSTANTDIPPLPPPPERRRGKGR